MLIIGLSVNINVMILYHVNRVDASTNHVVLSLLEKDTGRPEPEIASEWLGEKQKETKTRKRTASTTKSDGESRAKHRRRSDSSSSEEEEVNRIHFTNASLLSKPNKYKNILRPINVALFQQLK